jgi:ribose 5-phosphate isomerase B
MKKEIIKLLINNKIEVFDNGCFDTNPVDYPHIAKETCLKLIESNYNRGILICGTGIGMSIAANKIEGIRAALCSDVFSAKMAKAHNDANVITLGARTIGIELACEIVLANINSKFLKNIHEKRVKQINEL